MNLRRFFSTIWIDIATFVVIGVIFLVPFAFIFVTAAKTPAEASQFQFTWPTEFRLFENIQEVMAFGNYRMFLALWNSLVLTVGSVTLIVLFAALVAYVLQRRNDRMAAIVSTPSCSPA